MSEIGQDTHSLEQIYKVEDVKDFSKCFAKLHTNIASEFCKFDEKLKATTERVTELEKAMDHFEQDQLDLKESIVPGVREEAEKRDKTIHDEILALNLWGRKWNLIIHLITGEIRESSDVTRPKVH